MEDTTRDEIARALGSCLQEQHPLRRGGPGLLRICRIWSLISALTDEEVREVLLPRLEQLLAHLRGCFPCTAKALTLAVLIGEGRARLPGGHAGQLHNHLNRLDEANDHRRDYRGEVEAAIRRATGLK